jgi:hypothetical protein
MQVTGRKGLGFCVSVSKQRGLSEGVGEGRVGTQGDRSLLVCYLPLIHEVSTAHHTVCHWSSSTA